MLMCIITMGIVGILIIDGGHPLSLVNFAENENDNSPIEIGFGDIDGRDTEIGVGGYLSNRIVLVEYRDAGRTEDCAVFKTFATTTSAWGYKGNLGGRRIDVKSIYGNTKIKSSRKKRFRTTDCRNFAANGQAYISLAITIGALRDCPRKGDSHVSNVEILRAL